MLELGKQLLDSPLLTVFLVLVVIFLAKKGLFSVDTGPVKLGRTKEQERRILSAQINYTTLAIEAIEMEMEKKLPEVNVYHTKYVMEKCLDCFINRICLNHISDDKAFIEDVYLTMLALVRKRCKNDYFWSEDFEKYCKVKVEDILKHLYDIRKRLS